MPAEQEDQRPAFGPVVEALCNMRQALVDLYFSYEEGGRPGTLGMFLDHEGYYAAVHDLQEGVAAGAFWHGPPEPLPHQMPELGYILGLDEDDPVAPMDVIAGPGYQ